MLGLVPVAGYALEGLNEGAGISQHGTRVLVVREQPDWPRSYFYSGVQGPDVRPPVRDFLFQYQRIPLDHPPSIFAVGIPITRPPGRDLIQTVQEHSRGFTFVGSAGVVTSLEEVVYGFVIR